MNTELPAPGTTNLTWYKSSHSGGDGGECVEIATAPAMVHVRDSKQPTQAELAFPHGTWARFVTFAAVR